MPNAISSAVAGMMAASRRFEASAARVARTSAEAADTRDTAVPNRGTDADYVQEAVEQITAKLDFAANVQTARAVMRMSGRLLDITA